MKFVADGYLLVFRELPKMFVFWKWSPDARMTFGVILALVTIVALILGIALILG